MDLRNVLVLLLAFASGWSTGGTFKLTILHTNDVHARFDEINAFGGVCTEDESEKGKCYGGMARLKTKVDEIRSKEKNTLFLNAGDYYQGTLYFLEFSYNITADFTNRLKYDAVSLGNHEFDLGVDGLVPYVEKVGFPVMACNLDLSKVPSLKGKVACDEIFDFGAEKVAVIGFVTPETVDLSQPGDVIFLDEVEVLQNVVNKLKNKGIDKIIAVGHSGYAKDKEIARKVKGLDVVVGGHTNTFLYSGTPPTVHEEVAGPYPTVVKQQDGSEVLVIQAFAYAKYLGYLQVEFDDKGRIIKHSGNPILLDSSVDMDPDIVQALQPYKDIVQNKSSEVVGQTYVLLRGDRLQCRVRECNMGNLMADASVNYFSRGPTGEGWARHTIALYMSGGIRASIDEQLNHGNITMGEVRTVFPFGNDHDIAGLRGKHLRAAMEWSVQNYDQKNPGGAFLQISGLRVSYDLNRPPGMRVMELKALCSKCRVPRYLDVVDDQLYTIIMPSFLLDGGDGFKVIKDNAFNISRTGAPDYEILLKEIRRSSPLTNSEDQRIIFLESTGKSPNSVSLTQPLVFFSLAIWFLRC